MKTSKKVLSAFLALVMVVSMLATSAFAAGNNTLASSTVYEVSFATQEEIGTVQYANKTYKLLRVKINSSYNEFLIKKETGTIGSTTFPGLVLTRDFSTPSSEENYSCDLFGRSLSVTYSTSDVFFNNAQQYYQKKKPDITLNSGVSFDTGSTLLLYGMKGRSRGFRPENSAFVIFEWDPPATTGVNREKLVQAITLAPNEGFYKTGDRYNGKTTSTNGFWSDMQTALTTAQGVNSNSSAKQQEVDTATNNLTAAIANLIPITQANTTALYEQTSAKVYWNYNNELEINPKGINADYKLVSADNCTASTWSAYAAAKAEGQALMDSLFDKEGNATAANTADKQAEVERLAAAADPHTLVNAERYSTAYQTYRSRETEVNSLLSVYDPAKMKASDYTAASWQAYTDAYAALKRDMEHTIVGGTRADMDMLEGFTGHIDALKTARKGLVSDVDITVSFRYVNNFAAKYSQSGQSGMTAYATAVYEDRALSLKSGHTSVADAIKAAKIAFNTTNVKLPADNANFSDIKPLIAVYINGESYGLEYITTEKLADIQLHAGDDVRLARVCTPTVKVEASSGYDSTQIFEYLSSSETDYQDSYALINMTVPSGTVKVGDQAEFTATVTGASASKLGKPLDAENVTLFISEPTDSKTLTEPTKQTTAATDSSGRLQYIFTEPGWYTVAMYNVQDDVPTFTDVYNVTTIGKYYNLYAGDYALLYVAPADDEAALMAQYRAEYLAKANSYFEKFHDYDFAAGYYDSTFKPAYDTLKDHLNSAESFKALSEQFDADYQALLTCGAAAIDHAGTISALLGDLATVSDLDLSTLDTSYRDLLTSIQTAYSGLNAYQKTMLTGAQTARLDEIAAFDVSKLIVLPKVLVKVDEGADVKAVHKRTSGDTGNPYYGWPDLDWAMYPRPDGTIPTPGWATLDVFPANGEQVTAGSYVNVRRYLKTTDQAYWMVWSVDDGKTWNLSEAQTLGVYSGYYLATYRLPKTLEEGSSVTIKLKMLSKSAYDAILAKQDAQGIEGVKAAAIAAIQAAYDGYDQSKYDDAGRTALEKALEDGETAIREAGTTAAVAEARRTAIAAMAAVKPAGSSGTTENVTFDSGKTVGQVHVCIENSTYDEIFPGTIVEGWYELGENDTMMTMVLKALQNKGYSWNGTGGSGGDHVANYSVTYISSITKGEETLAEFTGGEKSGWMGTLNDWFTNEGFQAFSYANGKLESNDEIHIMYTCDYGSDIGGTWGSNDTSLKSLSTSKGTLTPAFDSAVTDYLLIVPDGRTSLLLTPEAANKNYQARIFLNQYNKDSAAYKRTETISVASGDTLYVGVGENGWPTMNSGGRATKYTIKVVDSSSADSVIELIKALETVTYSNYKEQAKQAALARSAYDALSDTSKQNVTNYQKLVDAENGVASFKKTADLSVKIAALPSVYRATLEDVEAVKSVQEIYESLTQEEKDHLTVNEYNKLMALIEKIDGLNQEAANKVIDDIAAIGSIDEITLESAEQIQRARAGYNALNRYAQYIVECAKPVDYSTLVDAEAKLKELQDAAAEQERIDRAAAAAVDSLIAEIGDVTLDSKQAIETARAAYDNLTPTQKTYVTKLNTLTAAETAYKALVDRKAADDVMEKINEIGEVTLDSKTAIEAARAAYNALTPDQKPLVENYNVLTAAEAELARLEAEAKDKADREAAAQVDEMIERLFPVNRYSGPAIRMARAAYEALTEDQKALVTRYNDLVRAEKEYAAIPPLTPSTPAKPSQKPDTSKDNLPFTDVTSGSWYYDGVKYACDNGLMNGTSANEFNPNANTTRSMIVTILARMEGVNTSGGATWYARGREWSMGAGISDGTNMTGKITREQLAAMLYRYAKLKGYDVSASADISGYTDASSVSSWATDAMRWAVSAGLINGRTATTLAPQGNATRAEVAEILMRVEQKLAK